MLCYTDHKRSIATKHNTLIFNFEAITNLTHKYLYSYNITILYMFRAFLSSSSGGLIVYVQHLVPSLSMSGLTASWREIHAYCHSWRSAVFKITNVIQARDICVQPEVGGSQLLDSEWVVGKKSRSQWPRGLRRRSTAARLLRTWVRIPPMAWMFVCCECCVLSGRGLCDGLIIRSEESYRL